MPNDRISGRGLLVALAWAIGCFGCAGGDKLATVPVEGTITQNGKPVEGALVSFRPEGSEGRSATGTTDASGKYKLTTQARDDGAIPGKYRVTVAKYEGQTQAEANTPAPNLTPEELAKHEEENYEEDPTYTPPSKNVLPAKYANAFNSGLEAVVVTGEGNTHDFELSGS